MPDATYQGPVPIPTPESKPFWQAAKQHRLTVQRCNACQQAYYYPRPLCPHCLSRDVTWIECSGRGTLHTFVINHRAPRKSPLPTPFVVAIVQLEEGPRMMTNLVGVEADPANIRCDMPVEVVFEDLTDEITVPRFRPVTS